MEDQVKAAVEAFRAANNQAKKQLVSEMRQRRDELTLEERLTLARVMQKARASGVTVTRLCEWYGTTSRNTVQDLLNMDTQSNATGVATYLTYERINADQVRIYAHEPIPTSAWEVATPSRPWQGEVVTDGVLTDNANYLWEELKKTDLPEQLGLKELFTL